MESPSSQLLRQTLDLVCQLGFATQATADEVAQAHAGAQGAVPWESVSQELGVPRQVLAIVESLARWTLDHDPDGLSFATKTAAGSAVSTGLPKLNIGDPVQGRYELLNVLGHGGMGIVHKAWDRELQRAVALKRLLPREETPSSEATERFLEEILATAQLQHPGIVQVFDMGQDAELGLFYCMELIEGQTLGSVAAGGVALGREERLLPLLRHFARVCQTVAYAHSRGIVHGDLKPSNIMVGAFDEVRVLDWGLASRVTSQASRPAEWPNKSIRGTPAYMAPEQARGSPANERSDVFALGGILYFVLTGKTPWTSKDTALAEVQSLSAAPDPRHKAPKVAKALAAICRRAMEPRPETRYASAGALADEIERYLDGRPVLAFPESRLQRAARVLLRRPKLLGGAAAAVVALLMAASAAALVVHRAKIFESQARRQAEDERQRAEEATARAVAAAEESEQRGLSALVRGANLHLIVKNVDDAWRDFLEIRRRLEAAGENTALVDIGLRAAELMAPRPWAVIHDTDIVQVAVSEHAILALRRDGSLRFAPKGELDLRPAVGLPGPVRQVWSVDGDARVVLWLLSGGFATFDVVNQEIARIEVPSGPPIAEVVVSRAHGHLAILHDPGPKGDAPLEVWDALARQPLWQRLVDRSARGLAFAGEALAWVAPGRLVLGFPDGRSRVLCATPDSVLAVAGDPDGVVVSFESSGPEGRPGLIRHDFSTGRNLSYFTERPLISLEVLDQGEILAATRDGRLLHLSGRGEVAREFYGGDVTGGFQSGRSRGIVAAVVREGVAVWSAGLRPLLPVFDRPGISTWTIDPRGQWLAAIDGSELSIVDLQARIVATRAALPDSTMTSLSFDEEGRRLILGNQQRAWDWLWAEGGAPEALATPPPEPPRGDSLWFEPGRRRSCRVWSGHKPLAEIPLAADEITLGITLPGDILVVAAGRRLHFFRLPDGLPLTRLSLGGPPIEGIRRVSPSHLAIKAGSRHTLLDVGPIPEAVLRGTWHAGAEHHARPASDLAVLREYCQVSEEAPPGEASRGGLGNAIRRGDRAEALLILAAMEKSGTLQAWEAAFYRSKLDE